VGRHLEGIPVTTVRRQRSREIENRYRPSFQRIAFLDQETGACGERRLNHSDGEADRSHRKAKRRGIGVRVRMEAPDYSRWFERWETRAGFRRSRPRFFVQCCRVPNGRVRFVPDARWCLACSCTGLRIYCFGTRAQIRFPVTVSGIGPAMSAPGHCDTLQL
jgi:hypothetical protein